MNLKNSLIKSILWLRLLLAEIHQYIAQLSNKLERISIYLSVYKGSHKSGNYHNVSNVRQFYFFRCQENCIREQIL